jgi:hypothetical protein
MAYSPYRALIERTSRIVTDRISLNQAHKFDQHSILRRLDRALIEPTRLIRRDLICDNQPRQFNPRSIQRRISRPYSENLVITQIFALADALFGRIAT